MSSSLKKKMLELLERDVEFRYAVAGYLGVLEVLKRLDSLGEGQAKIWENLNKLWENTNKLWEEVKALREDQKKLWEEQGKLRDDIGRLDRHLAALGARWGIMIEGAFREGLKGLLSREFGASVEKWEYIDREGYVYGREAPVEVGIVVSGGKVIVVEISAHVKASDVPIFKRKAELYEKVTGRKVSKLVFVTPFIDDYAKQLCLAYGIEVYTAV
ncbi:DUF3782 domain-containing protein [Infirmifilum lucidum]|uniref:DUF3782 domain-containing protein n=1 Tax=Infirmifilum lucidum TaxID=2776706 RepID=A0A7L9FHF5_9CREN|nr:DUF3782 domain-containing protein [Infirmifilum lucidum]QOJ79258.1 DUF3782 domain-containing protein [Infirmifilum lucidum]